VPDYLKTKLLIIEVRNRLKTGLSFNPKIVEKGSLAHWVGRPDPLSQCPAIFVEPIVTDPEPVDAGNTVRSTLQLRVLYVDTWDEELDADVIGKKTDRGSEIWSRLAGDTGEDWYLGGATVPGFQFDQAAVPAEIEWVPEEQDIVSREESRRLYAVAINVTINGRVTR
jgi:hypothetical protein